MPEPSGECLADYQVRQHGTQVEVGSATNEATQQTDHIA